MKKVAIIHTSVVSLEELKGLFKEILPEVEVINIIDDSLLEEVKKNDGLTSAIIGRMCTYAQVAEKLGVDLIFNQCSSVGEAAEIAKKCVSVPLLRVDEAMAEEACALGTKIGVIATVKSTMRPSCNLIKQKAELINKKVEVNEFLVDGALDILMKEKNLAKHNELVLDAIKKAAKTNDVIVLAQGSMTAILPYITGVDKPVLTSPRLGVLKAKKLLMKDVN